MLGAIMGDIIGSVYEGAPIKTKDFPLFDPHCRFTDDSVLTIAVAYAITSKTPYYKAIREVGRRYPRAGYGGSFVHWLFSDHPKPYNSWGNGSAMRVSPIGYAFNDQQSVLSEAEASAAITHNHPEGIKGAQATALAVFFARQGKEKGLIKQEIENRFGYNLSRSVDDIRPGYMYDISCQGTVPEAIIAFLDSTSFEDAIRNAVSLGGDSDTLACITGGIAEAYYKEIPVEILSETRQKLGDDLWEMAEVFYKRYGIDRIVKRLEPLSAQFPKYDDR